MVRKLELGLVAMLEARVLCGMRGVGPARGLSLAETLTLFVGLGARGGLMVLMLGRRCAGGECLLGRLGGWMARRRVVYVSPHLASESLWVGEYPLLRLLQ